MSGQPEGGRSGELARALGPVDATCIVIGAIIGVGIFFTPSDVAQIAGSLPIALGSWALAGGIAICGALAFSELGGMYPKSGGQYEALRDSYGRATGFVFVFCNATAVQGGAIAVIALVCVEYLGGALFGAAPEGNTLLISASVLIGLIMIANVVGVQWGAAIQNATVAAKLLTLLSVTALAMWAAWGAEVSSPPGAVVPTACTAPVQPGGTGTASVWVAALLAGLVPAFFSYGGWQHALWLAGEVRSPQRNVPLAITVGVLIVVAVYLLVNWAYLSLLGVTGVATSDAVAADAVAAVAGDGIRRVVAGAVALSAAGVLNAQLLAGPRLIHRLAQDGDFFAAFGRAHPRFRTPANAIALLGGIALVLLWANRSGGIGVLLSGVVFIDAVFFALTGLAVVVLRRKRPTMERMMKTPGYPVVPLLFFVGEIGVMVGAMLNEDDRVAVPVALAWIACAWIVFFLFFRAGTGDPASQARVARSEDRPRS